MYSYRMSRNILIIILVLFVSCEEYYVPELDEQAETLVFEGLITDQANEHFVRIIKANSYDDDSKYIDATGFEVYIEDENGSIISLTEDQPGYYKTDSLAKGSIGLAYRMVAESPEGKIYHSAWEELSAAAPIDSIYAERDEQLSLIYVNGTGYREEFVPGVNILSDLNAREHSLFYRYEFDLVYQAINSYDSNDPLKAKVYTARPESSMSSHYSATLNTNLYNQNEVTANKVNFLPLESIYQRVMIDSIELDYWGRPVYSESQIQWNQRGFLIQVEQYSLSQKGFQFWDAISKQGNASGEVFDPVETQLVGNIANVNDSTELVSGYFGASAVARKAVYMKLEDQGFLIKPLKYFPVITEPIASYSVFDFWVFEFDEL